jgi:hypothetical protein
MQLSLQMACEPAKSTLAYIKSVTNTAATSLQLCRSSIGCIAGYYCILWRGLAVVHQSKAGLQLPSAVCSLLVVVCML